jgi:NAD(P)-dependent dehydrogenase (short-subunit alcohol dehydrogenase family)
MSRCAVITGAGSGVGRAVALALVREGWRLALTGRRPGPLHETAHLTGLPARDVLVFECDITHPEQVRRMAQQVQEHLSPVEALVNAAGTNTPERSLEVLTFEKYRELMETNLTGAFLCAQAFLPEMRRRGKGTIVNVVSDAAKQASAKAGAAYVMSKWGQAGLTQAINAEERVHGIRACSIFPGDIDTPLLDKRPSPPDASARKQMLQAEDVAKCVLLAIELPTRAVVEEIVIRPV